MDVYIFRSQALLNHGMVDEMRDLLKQTEKKLGGQTTQHLLQELMVWINLKLTSLKTRQKVSEFKSFLNGGKLVNEMMSNDGTSSFQKCMGILSESNLMVTPKELSMKEIKDTVLEKMLKETKAEDTELLPKLYKLGDLLDLEPQQILEVYADKLIQISDFQGLYSVSQELCETYGATKVVRNMLEIIFKSGENLEVWENLEYTFLIAKTLLVNSNANEIEDSLLIFKKCDIMWNLIKSSDLGTYKTKLSNRSNDQPVHHLFKHFYKENVLVGSGKEYLRLLLAFFSAALQNSEWQNSKGKQKLRDISGAGYQLANKCFENQNFHGSICVIHFIHECLHLTGEQCSQEVLDLQTNCLKMMIDNVFLCEEIDFKFSLGCMLAQSREQAGLAFKNAIANAGKNYSRLNSIARVGVCMGSIWSQRAFQVNCMDLAKHFRWLQEFQILRNIRVTRNPSRRIKTSKY